jgi:hypothetical protein
LGIAVSSALFFGVLIRTGGDFHAAVGAGLASPIVLVGVAFVIGLVDLLRPSAVTDDAGAKERTLT